MMDMNKTPLVSIVVPIYNVQEYIGECVDSLFSQTYRNLEYVFVNDNTPDSSMDILSNKITQYGYTNKVKVINNSTNVGLAGVRIIGIKAAKGDYISIVDSDDKLSLDAIETMVDCALTNNADIVESDFYLYSNNGVNYYKRLDYTTKDEIICDQISLRTAVALWSKLYKKELFYDVEKLFIVGSKNIEDYYATPILYDRAKTITHLSDYTYYYRIDNINSGSRNKEWSKIEYLDIAVKHHESYFLYRKNSLFNDAINEAKYYIIINHYFLLSSKDKKRLSHLYPEIDMYVRKKGLLNSMDWWLIRRNYDTALKIFIGIRTRFLHLYHIVKTHL